MHGSKRGIASGILYFARVPFSAIMELQNKAPCGSTEAEQLPNCSRQGA